MGRQSGWLGSAPITFEQSESNSLGVVLWSPVDNRIAFIFSHLGITGEWLVNSDGSGLRELVHMGSAAEWAPDGRWLYYVTGEGLNNCFEKVSVEGGQPARIRCEPVTSQTISADGFTLLFASLSAADIEIRKAHPENSPFQVVARIPNSRIPGEVALWQPTLSPNRKSLVMPLIDKGTTNLWIMPADGGPLRRMTDFGSRSTLIERRVSWSPDGKFVYAALADTDADIVLLKHLLP